MDNPTSKRSGRRAPLPERKLRFLIAGGAVLLFIVILIASFAHSPEPAEEPAPAGEPAVAEGSGAEPLSETEPSPAPEPTPDAASQVPADVSAQLTARRLLRRDGFPMLSWEPDLFSADSRGISTTSTGARSPPTEWISP